MPRKPFAILGATGYIGSSFVALLKRENVPFVALSRHDAADSERLRAALERANAGCLINAAGFTGNPNVDACEDRKSDCLLGNAVLPGIIRSACETIDLPWGHVSSGCIYTGRRTDGQGFSEADPPNFSFRQNNCSFYSGTKALGEEVLAEAPRCYVWRLRIPFDNRANPRNYLYKLLNYRMLLEAENSLSHRDEFVRACVDCFRMGVPYGTYNLTNPGSVWTRDVTELMLASGITAKVFEFFADEAEFMQRAAKAPRSNCVLDSSKAIAAGLKLTPIIPALQQTLARWEA